MLSGFDSTGSSFASRGPRKNAFKIWNVTEKSLTFEHSNKGNYSVVAVGQCGKASAGSKKSRTSEVVVVLGSKTGEVQVWDASMEKQCAFTPFQDSVRQVLVHSSRQSVFVISEKQGDIAEHSLIDGMLLNSFKADKSHVSAICLNPDGTRLVSASTKLKTWSLEESPPRVVGKFVAPVNSVTQLHVSADGQFVLACDNSTSMLIYGLKESTSKMAAHCVVTSHENIVSAKFAPNTEGKPLTVYCLTSEGNIFVYGITAATPALLGTIMCSDKVTRTATDSIIQFVPLSHSTVRIARGIRSNPEFQLLDLRPKVGFGNRLEDVTLTVETQGEEQQGASEKRQLRKKVLSTRDGVGRPTATADNMDIDNSIQADDLADDTEKDLERRLLEVQKIAAPPSEVPRDEQSLADSCKSAADGDQEAITLLLAVEKNVIKKTMKNLAGKTVLMLLTKMLDRFKEQPASDQFLQWFYCAIVSHADAVSTDENFLRSLEGCIEILEKKVETRSIMLKLQGTVELLAYQSASVSAKLIEEEPLDNPDTEEEASEESDDGDFDFDDAH